MELTRYLVGLDLGQAHDPTALAILEQTPIEGQQHYAVRHLHRYPLGTKYPAIVADVAELLRRPPLPGCDLAVDATGVGRPVVELVRAADLPCRLHAITITGGHHATSERGVLGVPKKELVSTLQVLMQSGRLTVARALTEAATLVKELQDFQVKITPAANEIFGAWREGQHDDLVLAVAMAAWVGEVRKQLEPPRIDGPLVLNRPVPGEADVRHEHVRQMESIWGPMRSWGDF